MNKAACYVCAAVLAGCGYAAAAVVDFTDPLQFPVGSTVSENPKWHKEGGEACTDVTPQGVLLLPGKHVASASFRYAEAIEVPATGDAITVSVDFTYDQVTTRYQQDVIRVGAGNGRSSRFATFHRKGWGDYHAIGREGYPEGVVFETRAIGFAKNESAGTSDPLRLTMTLTRVESRSWDMVVLLTNLNPGSDLAVRWEAKGLSLDDGPTDRLWGMMQAGVSDAAAGVANRTITRFSVSDEPSPPPPPQTWRGVHFKDYLLPMKPRGPLRSEGIWGSPHMMPRDPNNGLEDRTMENWCYWDGSIVRDDGGTYHIYACRWDQRHPHGQGWKLNSKAIHAVSEDAMGPYRDLGMTWPHWQDGEGCNVVGLRMHDGRYAAVTSETTAGEVFVSDDPYGPWTLLGEIQVDLNGFPPGLARYPFNGHMSNVQILLRPDGRYMLVPRSTAIMISEQGILGPYKILSGRVYEHVRELPKTRMEDPTLWYSGGMYHMLVNHWPGKTTYHLSSTDGIHDWTYRGVAYRKDEQLFRYTDGTADEWAIVQRPTAYTEDGHATHFNFSVIDVTKGADRGHDNHGSKIIVVPFDGEAFDRDMQRIVAEEQTAEGRHTQSPAEDFLYQPDWESIRSRYQVPDWFGDAKFGIFLHWGPYAVPAYMSEKYPKGIYAPGFSKGGMNAYRYHRERYGDPSTFGYKDLVPLFRAEKFDADAWATLFKQAGARYVVPVAEHHDGFAMYGSRHTRWNVVGMGPKRDTMRLLADACRAQGLKFGVSSHYAGNRTYYDSHDPDWDTNDPEYFDLYGKPVTRGELPTQAFLDHWWDRTTDIIDQYEPDLVWFDFGLDRPGFEPLHKRILAYYYNQGLAWGKEVVFQSKNMRSVSFPEDLIVLDIERGRMSNIHPRPWQTDTSVGKISWGYIDNEEYKSADYLIDELIDIVSKNGCLLLNIGPKADGTIPEEAQGILKDMGAWLRINGEAIYSTRPWKIYGEGPTQISGGHHTEKRNKEHVAADIRFTTRGDTLYATSLGWPADGVFTINSLARESPHEPRPVQSVERVSGDDLLAWEQTPQGLVIPATGEPPDEAAYTFRIRFDN